MIISLRCRSFKAITNESYIGCPKSLISIVITGQPNFISLIRKGCKKMAARISIYQNNKQEEPANGSPCRESLYDIVIEKNFEVLADEMMSLSPHEKKVCIVSDTNVAPYYLGMLTESIKKHVKGITHFTFKAGEGSKNLDTVSALYAALIEAKFDRKDILVALGGGVVGDLTGFAAATYLRGIDYIQVPTTLLSQVDSSIGGKTGVDFKQYKNMVGAFYHPKLVFINLNTLSSLPEREFFSGMAEVIKHGLIKDSKYYQWLLLNKEKIKNLDMDIIEQMILQSCMIKKAVVEEDFYEKGDRALLNFGHTIGHAVEKLMDFSLLHGECVAIGMAFALQLSVISGNIAELQRKEAIGLLEEFNLPVSYSGLDESELIETILLDKKMESGKLKFILLKDIGNAVIDKTVSLKQLEKLMSSIKENRV